MQERTESTEEPKIKGNLEEYTFDFIGPSDLGELEENDELKSKRERFQKNFDKGYKCLCARHQGQIVAHTWFNFKECQYLDTLFTLKEHEVYLFDMYTLNSYRGKNIAPYLRFKSYKMLNKMGIETIYSITDFFNSPAVKFKQKLGVKFLGLYLKIDLFRKWKRDLKIKEYET
jgi:hypothetical protein